MKYDLFVQWHCHGNEVVDVLFEMGNSCKINECSGFWIIVCFIKQRYWGLEVWCSKILNKVVIEFIVYNFFWLSNMLLNPFEYSWPHTTSYLLVQFSPIISSCNICLQISTFVVSHTMNAAATIASLVLTFLLLSLFMAFALLLALAFMLQQVAL